MQWRENKFQTILVKDLIYSNDNSMESLKLNRRKVTKKKALGQQLKIQMIQELVKNLKLILQLKWILDHQV